MNKYVQSDVNQHIMKLIQLGAEVKAVKSNMVYVEFLLEQDIKLSYVYNLNKKNKYFLERIKPYPIPLKEFNTASEVIDMITIDLNQFNNAIKSQNVKKFIEIGKSLHQTIKTFEDLFLYFNVSAETLSDIKSNIEKIDLQIKNSAPDSSRVFFDKDPENL